MGTCFSQQPIEQNRSFMRPVLHEATVHRIADVPGGINLRHVAQTRLAMASRYHIFVRVYRAGCSRSNEITACSTSWVSPRATT